MITSIVLNSFMLFYIHILLYQCFYVFSQTYIYLYNIETKSKTDKSQHIMPSNANLLELAVTLTWNAVIYQNGIDLKQFLSFNVFFFLISTCREHSQSNIPRIGFYSISHFLSCNDSCLQCRPVCLTLQGQISLYFQKVIFPCGSMVGTKFLEQVDQ